MSEQSAHQPRTASSIGVELLEAENMELRAQVTQLRGLLNAIGFAYMEKAEEQVDLKLAASTDDLTGLMSRQAFSRHALDILKAKPPEIPRRHYDPERFVMIFLDIDRFKEINDTHGHPVGDSMLRQVAERVRLRDEDLATSGRFGGEELVVMLPWTGLQAGLMLAEKLRNELESSVQLPDGRPVTASFGVAEGYISEASNEVLATALSQADRAMYHVKNEGRNGVAYFDSSIGECQLFVQPAN